MVEGYMTINCKWPNVNPKTLKYFKKSETNCPNNRLA